LHASQEPLQAASQHSPSAQKREAHWPVVEQLCPFGRPHWPVGPQVLAPVQVSASWALVTGEQTPGFAAVSQAMQVPVQLACSQQTPSTQ
jgi:hypothetical protein